MARVLSEYVTDREANDTIDTELAPGYLREIVGVAATSAIQTAADTIHFARVPSNAIMSELRLYAAASTAGAMDVGIYDTQENGGAAVDADLFASAASLIAANNGTDITFESGQYTFAESEKPLWEVLGLASDPHKEYDVVGTVTTTFVAGPTSIRLAVRYRQ